MTLVYLFIGLVLLQILLPIVLIRLIIRMEKDHQKLIDIIEQQNKKQ